MDSSSTNDVLVSSRFKVGRYAIGVTQGGFQVVDYLKGLRVGPVFREHTKAKRYMKRLTLGLFLVEGQKN